MSVLSIESSSSKRAIVNQLSLVWKVPKYKDCQGARVVSRSFYFPLSQEESDSPDTSIQLQLHYFRCKSKDNAIICLKALDSREYPSIQWNISLSRNVNNIVNIEKFATQNFIGITSGNCWEYSLESMKKQLSRSSTLTVYCEILQIEPEKILPPPRPVLNPIESTFGAMSADFGDLFATGKNSDVVLVVENNQELPAHKLILSTRSPVFAAMFEHDLEENRQNRVEIPDVSLGVIQELLRFLYTGKISGEYSAELFIAADKYQVNSLKTLCEDSLSRNLTTESAKELLTLASMHSAESLIKCCIDFIIENGGELSKEDWKRIPMDSELSFMLFNKAVLKQKD